MSDCTKSGDFRRAANALVAMIGVALFLCAAPAWAAHRRHRTSRAHTTHTSRAHRARSRYAHAAAEGTAHHSHVARARRSSPTHHSARTRLTARAHPIQREARSSADLEPDRPTVNSKLAQRPLKSFLSLPPLRGSRESLLRQNRRADEEGLKRVENDKILDAMTQSGALVALPQSRRLRVDPRLDTDRRYCRPWTAHFLTDLAQAFYARFDTPLKVDSAVRTVQYQRQLLRVNSNAAPAEGEIRSPHLTGEAIDISKKGLSRAEVGWLRAYLMPLQSQGRLDVEEEFHQACFHISVYKSYHPAGEDKRGLSVAQASTQTPAHPQAGSHAAAPGRRSSTRHTTPLLATRLP